MLKLEGEQYTCSLYKYESILFLILINPLPFSPASSLIYPYIFYIQALLPKPLVVRYSFKNIPLGSMVLRKPSKVAKPSP
jgi:hypothetical protein